MSAAALPSPRRPRRARAVAGLAAAVLALHALLLGAWPEPPVASRSRASPPHAPQAVQAAQVVLVRQIGPKAPSEPAPAPEQGDAPSLGPPWSQPRMPPQPRPQTAPRSPPGHRLPPEPVAIVAARADGPASPDGGPPGGELAAPHTHRAASEPGATPTPPGKPIPVYATQLPPAATLVFSQRRGDATTTALLSWQPSPEGYLLSLEAQTPASLNVNRVSRGGADAAGLAPLRYSEGRRGRELRAANFQREAGRISFSGPAVEHPLVHGAQDRLSWMIQLAAILQADPTLGRPGQEITLFVVGTRGDAEPWVFSVVGSGALELPSGVVDPALELRREPRRPYDTQVRVWLDPARHHLPVQMHLAVPASGQAAEFALTALRLP